MKKNLTEEQTASLAMNATYWRRNLGYGLSGIGLVGGIYFAVKRKSGFWGGLGWALLGSMAGSATGFFIGSFLDKSKETEAYNKIIENTKNEAKPAANILETVELAENWQSN